VSPFRFPNRRALIAEDFSKLNPVTTDEDLELIFSRFGRILSCGTFSEDK
jgi:hypothetical protein